MPFFQNKQNKIVNLISKFRQVVVENVKGDSGGRGAFEYGDITVDEGSRVSSDLVFDPQRMHLYAMTERKVYILFLISHFYSN